MNKINKSNISAYILIAVIVLTVLVLRFFVGTVIAVSGSSMYPTFENGGFVFGTYVTSNTEIEKNDVVVVSHDNKLIIKRVAALPGEKFTSNNGTITLSDTQYAVLGDNAAVSNDSRYFGAIERDDIVYKYSYMYWTNVQLIITVLLPIILLLAAATMVFIPSDKQHIPLIGKVTKSEPDAQPVV